ncbi:unnamed protein product [Caenorhabditis nigoni]
MLQKLKLDEKNDGTAVANEEKHENNVKAKANDVTATETEKHTSASSDAAEELIAALTDVDKEMETSTLKHASVALKS